MWLRKRCMKMVARARGTLLELRCHDGQELGTEFRLGRFPREACHTFVNLGP